MLHPSLFTYIVSQLIDWKGYKAAPLKVSWQSFTLVKASNLFAQQNPNLLKHCFHNIQKLKCSLDLLKLEDRFDPLTSRTRDDRATDCTTHPFEGKGQLQTLYNAF